MDTSYFGGNIVEATYLSLPFRASSSSCFRFVRTFRFGLGVESIGFRRLVRRPSFDPSRVSRSPGPSFEFGRPAGSAASSRLDARPARNESELRTWRLRAASGSVSFRREPCCGPSSLVQPRASTSVRCLPLLSPPGGRSLSASEIRTLQGASLVCPQGRGAGVHWLDGYSLPSILRGANKKRGAQKRTKLISPQADAPSGFGVKELLCL